MGEGFGGEGFGGEVIGGGAIGPETVAVKPAAKRAAAGAAQARTAGAGKAVRPKAKRKAKPPERWSREKEIAFLAALVRTANVAASARAARVSETGVYRHRAKSAEFRQAWGVALRDGYARLELMMLERALNGEVKPVFFGGKQVGEITEYSDRVALALLAAHRGTVMGPAAGGPAGPGAAAEDMAALRRALETKFGDMARRLGAAAGDGPAGDAEVAVDADRGGGGAG